jgi:hypothetical protein
MERRDALKQMAALAASAIGRTPERDRDVERKRKQRAEAKTVVVPACKDRARREALELDDFAWLKYYGHELFWYDFTPQQRAMIESIGNAIKYGGDQALAASRGEGKTKNFEWMLLKYTLSGAIKFAVLFAASGAMAENSLQSMRDTIERNERLCEDYPEICVPVRALEDTPNRAHYQLVTGHRHDNGEPYEAQSSRFTWCGHEIIYPNVPGSPAAWGIIATRGLDAAVRGLNRKNRRPEVVGIDDPDTEDTVRSIEQAQKLEERIDRGIAGLGGQQRGVARVMLTTLQRPECVSAWFTDPRRKPTWKGKRYRFLIQRPERQDLWEDYIEQRRIGLQGGDDFCRTAHNFYLANREEMDRGAEVANPHRFNPQILPDGSQLEVSALQRYFNEVARIGQDAVSTEYDNDPKDDTADGGLLTPDQIAAKINGYTRGMVPGDCQHLTAMVDVQGKLLYWVVVAWRADFTGYVVDYGAWPEQRRQYYTLSDAVPTIPDKCPGGFEASIFGAVTQLTGLLCGREWPRDGGGLMRISRCLIDANWGDSRDTIYSACRQSSHATVLLPTHGKGIKASGAPIHMWPVQQGEKSGTTWVIRRSQNPPIPYGIYDSNVSKSLIHARLCVPMGGPGCLSLFKAEPQTHRMLADHCHAEYPTAVEVSGGGRKVNEWQQRPNHPDNHFFDCLVGNCVAASMLGVALPSDGPKKTKERKPLGQMGKAS